MKPYHKLELPHDFAQNILDNQIQFKLSDQPSSQTICNLILLYSQGVQYYQSIKSHKYLYFKRKMQEIFTCDKKLFTDKQQVAVEQNQSPIQKKMKSKNEQQRIQALKIKDKQQKMEFQVNQRINKDATKRQAEKLMKNSTEQDKIIAQKIQQSLQKQDLLLEEKIRQRKKKSFTKSFSAFGLTQSTQTKSSLFTEDFMNKPNQKGIISPLIVDFNFQALIKQKDSDDQKQIILKKKSHIARGRMSSMRKLME